MTTYSRSMRVVAAFVALGLLGVFELRTMEAQETRVLAQNQAEGVRAALDVANVQLAGMGARTRLSQIEWLTRSETGQVGQSVPAQSIRNTSQ